ncbi:hypothetical protein DPEC_G00054910 [Dallia pectoralis]|uniref:Uncharacterized protein n=1 Tax=Dallia pectoralis TaxID=75939 RepID=A0ACC2H5H6_DALPE|nr:hypothetical protein DPEC_G00054910 [Dallia pectoralis]
MKCPQCGHQCAESSKFCSECGRRLLTQSQICTSDGTTSEPHTSVTCEAKDEGITPSGSKTDTPLTHCSEKPDTDTPLTHCSEKPDTDTLLTHCSEEPDTDTLLTHCSEEPGGNVRKKSEGSFNITAPSTETCQEKAKSSATSAVDVPPVNTPTGSNTPTGDPVTPTGTPTIPVASLIPSPLHGSPEHQTTGPSKVDVSAPMNETNTRLPSSTSVMQELPEKTHKTDDLNTRGAVSDSNQPARKPSDKNVLKGTSRESSKSTKSPGKENNITIPDEVKSSSNQTIKNTKNEGNSEKCVETSEITDDPRVSDPTCESNKSQTQPPGPTRFASPELPEKTSSLTDESMDLVKEEHRSASPPEGQRSYKDALVGASRETGGLSSEVNRQGENKDKSSHGAECGDKPKESTQALSNPNQEPENVSKSTIADPLPANINKPPNQCNEDRFQQESRNDKPILQPQLSQNTNTFHSSDTITVYFHAIISKNFKLDPKNDKIYLRSGLLIGDWEKNIVEMNISGDLGKDRSLFAGQVVLPIKNHHETLHIPYKYYVCKWNGKTYEGHYEHIFQTSSNQICNRVLIIAPYLLTHKGEWHQYDDIIYPELKKKCNSISHTAIPVSTMARQYHGVYHLEKQSSPVVRTPRVCLFACPEFNKPHFKKHLCACVPNCLEAQRLHIFSGIVILLVNYEFEVKEDNRSRLDFLCQWLCLPNKHREDFLTYWTEFIKGLPEKNHVAVMVEYLCIRAREAKVENWILVIPLLHLLKGASKPFEPMELNMEPQSENWTGLKGIQTDRCGDTRALVNLMTQHRYLVQVDHLLVRSWMSLLEMEDLPGFVLAINVGILDTLHCLQFSLTVKFGSYYHDNMKPVGELLIRLIEKISGQEIRDTRYGERCLKTAVEVLGIICQKNNSNQYEIPLDCLSLVSQIAEAVGNSCPQSEESKKIEATQQALQIMREWRKKTSSNKLLSSKTEIKVWNRLIAISFGNKELNEQWRSAFLKDFEWKLNMEKPMQLVKIYCEMDEEMNKTSSLLRSSLEKCAIGAITSICQDKSKLSDLLNRYDFCKFGKLMSAIVLRSWPKTADKQYAEGEELVMEHLLSWPMAKSLFEEQGSCAGGAVFNRLTGEAKERMEMARSAFCSVTNKLIAGNIQIKILNLVLQRKAEFTELLNIESLCDDGRCQDLKAMRRLLKWREEEVEAVGNDKEIVDSVLIFCHKLNLTIDVKELERKNLENIVLMNLDQLMEVHSLDKDSSGMTGRVTYFNLSDIYRQMASKLHAVRESFIFTMCWENHAKVLSHKQLDTNDEELQPEMEREVFTLDQIQCKIFQSAFDNYNRLYNSLKSGTISLKEVDSTFEYYKGKYEDMEKDLKIMCRINCSDKGTWIKGRLQQIQQYHDIYCAFESAKVIMNVKATICPQGDFKVLQTLLDMNTEDFKEESLNCIDENLLEIKKVLEDISETRRKCLQELGMRQNFVKWVKEDLQDINELKVFVDLASISAGENDLDVDRVSCFHDAVLGYSSLLYGLPQDADFNAFREALEKLWKALSNDCNIPNKLRDTARHLEWLKKVKDSHGSVELSSLSLASSINTSGLYVISAENQQKLSLDTALKLQIPEQQNDEIRNYSLEDLKELQNKLMLMSGKGEQSKSEVVYFTEIFEGVWRLALAFVNLHAAGNPLFRCWEAKIHCNKQCDSGITMDFNLGDILQEIRLEGNAMDQLTDLCRKIEMCLDDWSTFMDKQRSQHYYLNYYTAEQIVHLCNVLTEKNVNTKWDEKISMLLSFIKPDCTLSDVLETWNIFHNNHVEEADHDEENSFQTFLDLHDDTSDENKCCTDVLQSLVDNAVGFQKLNLIWNAYMRDMRSILNDSLDITNLGILLEMLANMENQEDDGEDLFVSNPSQNIVKRKLPVGLNPDQPNLIICPRDSILTTSICLYMTTDYEEPPTYDEVLLCTPATSYEQVELFFRRCLTPGYMGEKIYTLLFADQLSYEVSYAVEKLFRKLSSINKIQYKLLIICSADREHAYIPSAFNHFKRSVVPQVPLESIQEYLSRHYTVPSNQTSAASVFKGRHFVGIVDSQRAGVGKSLYIQRLYEQLEGTVTVGTTFCKCIRLTEPIVDEHTILQSLYDTPDSKKHKVFHLDVTSSVQKGLHEFVFKLFFLRYLMDSDGQMWKCSNNHLYVIETLQSTYKLQGPAIRSDLRGHISLFEVFPKVFCHPPQKVMVLEIQNRDESVLDTEDPLMDDQCFKSEAFQRPYQYLTRFHRGENLDCFNYKQNSVEGSHAECLEMLFNYCGMIDPSWAELRNFAWFLNLQLLDCETSVFCSFEFVGDTLGGFRNFVVDFMILMAKDFATPSLHMTDQSHGRQLHDNGQTDLVPLCIRKRWESEPHPYIFFNDDHQSMTYRISPSTE